MFSKVDVEVSVDGKVFDASFVFDGDGRIEGLEPGQARDRLVAALGESHPALEAARLEAAEWRDSALLYHPDGTTLTTGQIETEQGAFIGEMESIGCRFGSGSGSAPSSGP